jgi:hypothetical protein
VDEARRPTPIEDKAGGERDHRGAVGSQIYTIRIKGHLDDGWSEWLDHWTIKHEEDGTTVLTGSVTDPPAMYGLLINLPDLGLSLISVNRKESDIKEHAKRKCHLTNYWCAKENKDD